METCLYVLYKKSVSQKRANYQTYFSLAFMVTTALTLITILGKWNILTLLFWAASFLYFWGVAYLYSKWSSNQVPAFELVKCEGVLTLKQYTDDEEERRINFGSNRDTYTIEHDTVTLHGTNKDLTIHMSEFCKTDVLLLVSAISKYNKEQNV